MRLSAVWIQPLPPGKHLFCLSWDRTCKPVTSSFTKWASSLFLPRLYLFHAGSSSPLCLKNFGGFVQLQEPTTGRFPRTLPQHIQPIPPVCILPMECKAEPCWMVPHQGRTYSHPKYFKGQSNYSSRTGQKDVTGWESKVWGKLV